MKRPCLLIAVFLVVTGITLGEAKSGKNRSALQIDLFGGFSLTDPNDLNRIVDYENSIQHFFYDDHLSYLQGKQELWYWNKTGESERKRARNSLPLGVGIHYSLSPRISLYLGFEYFRTSAVSNLEATYTRALNANTQQEEKLAYTPFSISATAYVPKVGIEWRIIQGQLIGLNLFLTGGPLLTSCRYYSDWTYDWNYVYKDYANPLFHEKGKIEMKGKATGIALEPGIRLNCFLSRRFGLFLDMAYAYQKAKNISGPGREERNGKVSEWEGTWAMKKESIETPWGSLDIDVPNNNWPAEKNWQKSRDFSIDLSGPQMSLGFFFRI